MKESVAAIEMDLQTAWLQEVVIAHTPRWAHLLAQMAQYRGMRWMYVFPIPIVRKLTDVSIKTETHMDQAGKGFRKDSVKEWQTIRVFKRGRMVAEKTFPARIITKSHYSKLV